MTDTFSSIPAPDGAHAMPSGAWVHLRDPRLLTRGDKKAIIRAGTAAENGIESGYAVGEGLLRLLIDAWSYPVAIPSENPDALDAVPAMDDPALFELIEPARVLLFPGAVTPDDHADERSPTGPSSE